MDTLTTCKTLLLFLSIFLVQASVIPENNSEEIEKMLGGDISHGLIQCFKFSRNPSELNFSL